MKPDTICKAWRESGARSATPPEWAFNFAKRVAHEARAEALEEAAAVRRGALRDAMEAIDSLIVPGVLSDEANERRNGIILAYNQLAALAKDGGE